MKTAVKAALVAAVVFGALLAGGHSGTDSRVYGIEHARLDNGMEVYVIPNHRVPAVTHMVWYRVGAIDEPKGESGVAHYLEHMMFKGTKTVKDGELSKRVHGWGGNDNAFTAYDYTAYFQVVPKEHLHDVMAMEADRMNNLSPDLKGAESELQVVLSERKERTENEPSARLGEQMNAAVYGDHPYGLPIIGWEQEIEGLTWPKAKQFYDAHYAPNNAILVVSGDTTLADVVAHAQDTYGKLPSEQVIARNLPPVVSLKETKTLTLQDKSVQQPIVYREVLVPSYHTDSKQALALTVLADIIDGSTGALYQDLVVRQKLVSAIDVHYSPTNLDKTTFSISAVPLPGVTPDVVKAALENSLKHLDVTAADRERSLQRIIDASVFERDSLAGPAMNVGFGLVSGIPANILDTWPQQLRRVTMTDLGQAAHLVSGTPIYGYLLP